MREMKFRVESEKHSRQIQEALFRLGYSWYSGGATVQWETCDFLYAEADGFLMHSTAEFSGDRFFEGQSNEEYVYRLGLVEPRGDRPVQDVPPPVFQFPAEELVHDGLSADKIRVGTIQIQPPPLGLRPAAIAEHMFNVNRKEEVVGAMTRYIAEFKEVPLHWLQELNALMEKIRNYEKTTVDTSGSVA